MNELKALTPIQQRYFDQQHDRGAGGSVPSVEEIEGPAPQWPTFPPMVELVMFTTKVVWVGLGVVWWVGMVCGW